MKKLISAATATIATSLLLGGVAVQAQPYGGGHHGPRGGKMIEMLDVNKDGTITRAEATDALAKHFDMMDTDRNGTVTQAERQAARGRMMQDRFAKMDADKNGQLSQQEFMAAHQARHDAMKGRMGGKMGRMMSGDFTRDQFLSRPMAMFDRFDTNKDGQITAAEREAAKQTMRERWEARKDQRNAG